MLKIIILSMFFLGLYPKPAFADDMASQVFRSSLPGIFQIAVIDKRTQEKEAIGSGFKVESDSALPLIATNYHVISEYARVPDQFDIEYRTEDGASGKLDLIAIDVVHDLAVLASSDKKLSVNRTLPLSREVLSKGQKVFAIGNPHDKGMIVVEGAYGGTIENKFYNHLIFSGASLNPGMSGGPALNEAGRVVGINVAIAANDINYLVPVSALGALIDSAEKESFSLKRTSLEWRKIIAEQVLARQRLAINALVDVVPHIADLKGFSYPKNLDPSFKCWGGSFQRDKFYTYNRSWVFCGQENDIFVNSDVRTGKIKYALAYMDGSKISREGFDDEYSEYYGSSWLTEDEGEEDMNEFECKSGFTRHADNDWKTALCTRTYKGYPYLYDVYFSSAVLGHSSKGYYYKISLEGVDIQLAKSFLGKLTESIAWKE